MKICFDQICENFTSLKLPANISIHVCVTHTTYILGPFTKHINFQLVGGKFVSLVTSNIRRLNSHGHSQCHVL